VTSTPHICHVFSRFDVGGAELGTARVVNGLGRRYRYTILALDGGFGAAEHLDSHLDVVLKSLPPGRIGSVRSLTLRAMLRAIRPDLLVTHNWGSMYAIIGAVLGRVGPIVHQEHGYGRDGAVGPVWQQSVVRRVLLQAADLTIVPSRTLEEVALRHYGLRRSRLLRIPNGVDTERFSPQRDLAWRRAHGVPDDALLIGWVARLRAEKDLPLLLRAFARAGLANAWLAIVGDGPCREAWRGLADQLGVSGRVIFAGQVDDPRPCYAAFDVFAMSSTTEQMPNVLLEAMASELPAICTDVGDSREILGDDQWIVPPGDEVAYARTLATLADRPALRAELGAANRSRCVEQYPLRQMVARYGEAIARVMNGSRRPR
jgi:glycosyltransferase involved in cell wall biosynthesis